MWNLSEKQRAQRRLYEAGESLEKAGGGRVFAHPAVKGKAERDDVAECHAAAARNRLAHDATQAERGALGRGDSYVLA